MTTPESAAHKPEPTAADSSSRPGDRADSTERLRRDEPDRTEPNRQTASVLLPGAGETVDAGVNTAYKVLGDYLRRGQEAAKNQEDSKNPWSLPGAPLVAGMATIPLQVFRAWAQMATSMAELSMIPGAAEGVRQTSKLIEDFWASLGVSTGNGEAKPDGKSDATKSTPARTVIRVAVELASAQPTEVEIEFDPPAGVVPMIQRLHPLRGEAPPLTALEFFYDPASERAKLSLAIPATQELGRYVGTIFDDRDDRACGTIKVRVGD
jgi:hypothetical protein